MNTQIPIAIIGMSCRFPDAPNIKAFRENLMLSHDAIRKLSLEDMEREGINPSVLSHEGFINAGTFVDNVANFDYGFFSFSPKEASLLDPQHRLFLEECRKLLDVSNLIRDEEDIGIFAGCRQSTYQALLPRIRPEHITGTESFQQLLGNDKDYLATRVSYHLNLSGPAMNVQTACSTSLVAVHQACQSLRNQECRSAFAGGSAISFPQGMGYRVSEGMIFSDDGKCRPFSAEGTGIVAGNGLGVVALKRLDDAIEDGNQIHAVIRGSAISNDGKAKLGYTAPSKFGQKKTIERALQNSGIDPKHIGLLEAHGTGTPLGDPIEVQAISEVYDTFDVPNQNCAIGSVKGNVGHLDTAAGVASLIKSVLAVRDGLIFPTLHCRPENPHINFDSTPFYLADECSIWPKRFKSRIAAVSSFGIGGTNCHVILEQPPKYEAPPINKDSEDVEILTVSNHQKENVLKQAKSYVSSLEADQIQEQCKTVALKRNHYPSRIAVCGKTKKEISKSLKKATVHTIKPNPKVAWVFSGQGSQKAGMGKMLYQTYPVFREAFDYCSDLFNEAGIVNLTEIMFDKDQSETLNKTLYTQAALFTWQYAMGELLTKWGFEPDVVTGHSIGEFAASVVAGHLSVESSIKLVAHRAHLMQEKTTPGAMLAVQISEQQLHDILKNHDSISIASINSINRFTLSGSKENVEILRKDLDKSKIAYKPLEVNRAFHSSTMEAIKSEFYNHCLELEDDSAEDEPSISMYSTFTTEAVECGQLTIDYWFKQLRNPVKFYQTLQSVALEKPDLVIEISPDGSFLSLLKHSNIFDEECEVSKIGYEACHELVANLFCLGYDKPLEEHYANKGSRFTEMPPLVFSDNRCWTTHKVSESDNQPDSAASLATQGATDKINFWEWQWERLPGIDSQHLQKDSQSSQHHWCVVGGGLFLGKLKELITAIGDTCDIVDELPVNQYDRLIDARPLALDWQLRESINSLEASRKQLVGLGQYAESHPDCQIITLISSSQSKNTLVTDPHQDNPLWPYINLTRNFVNEKPDLSFFCLDINGYDINSDIVSILLQPDKASPILSWKGDNLYSLKVISRALDEQKPSINWCSEHFTLIAGLGAVGIGLAEWLVDKGCDKLIFIVRQALNDQQQHLIENLKNSNVTIHVLQASLIEEGQLQSAFDLLDVTISRVFHTAHAGTHKLHPLDDAAAFGGSLPVKVIGSMNLYNQLKDQALDFFCMFTSLSSMMAISGTSGYATANAWQDSYAAYLREQGIPALTVSWSQLQLSRDAQYVSSVNETGIIALTKEQSFDAMEKLIQQNESGLTPIIYDPIVLQKVVNRLPATSSYLSHIFSANPETASADKDKAKDNQPINLENLNSAQINETVSTFIHRLICDRLHYEDHQLDVEASLTGQGVDSLIFLEIVQVINKSFGLDLPPTAGYEHGTISALSRYITDQLHQSDIEFSGQLAAGDIQIVANPQAANEPFPLTDLQQAYWFGRRDDMDLGHVSCHEYMELEFDTLAIDQLESAWNRLIDRHDMMRCVITEEGQQRIMPPGANTHYAVTVTDLSGVTDKERETHLAKVRQRMSYQVFNPHTWPLFEVCVSQWQGAVRVHIDLDLLVFDVQSIRIIYGELETLLRDPEATLSDLQLTFRDYILAEKAQEKEARWLAAQDYWQERLSQMPAAPDLPRICKTATLRQPSFRMLEHCLERDTWESFKQYAHDFGLTPSGAMLTAYAQALALYAKAPEFIINVTSFNRKNVHPEVMNICGDFTSLVLLPVSVSASETFLDAAKRTQQELWQALEHRDYNGIRVMRDLGRNMGISADAIQMPVVFTSMIGMDFDDPSQAGWDLQRHQIFDINQTPQVWLDYQAAEIGGALLTRWFIAEDLFDPIMIEGLFSAYTGLLDHLAKSADVWRQMVPDLRNQEARTAMQALNSVAETPSPDLMPDSFHACAAKMPDMPALLTQNESVSYQQMQTQVNRLAAHLIGQGLAPAEPVAVVMPKSIDAVIAALAIQTAGGCYTPVNADYENQRLIEILSDLEPFAVLTSGDASLSLSCPLLNMDKLDLSAESEQRPEIRQSGEDLAYIVYTSGTTGVPKGVMLDHTAPLNTLQQLAMILDVGPHDRTLSMCAFHHGMSVFDLYAMLSTGGAVILPQRDKAYDALHWFELMQLHKPTILNAVPAFVAMLLEAIERRGETPPAPRHIMMGGDWIALDLVRRIHVLWPETQVHSIGGSTETAIVSTHYCIDALRDDWTRIPYGRPLPNQTCVLLNAAGQECLPGLPGEICMGGMARSLGYYNAPELTAEKYRPHPFSGEPLFHTGDMGILRPDGQLDILGRIDDQIKIRGVQIEDGEIKAAIEQLPEISEAVVLYTDEPTNQLHGFVKTALTPPCKELVDGHWNAAVESGNFFVDKLPDGFDLADFIQYNADIELLSTWAMLRIMQAEGFFMTTQESVNLKTLLSEMEISPKNHKLFASWVSILVEDGYLEFGNEGYRATSKIDEANEFDCLQARIVDYVATGEPYQQGIWSTISGSIERAGSLLDGSFNPLELMYGDGKTDSAESWYRENPVSMHFNRIAGHVAGAFLADRQGPLRILEFGAGIGSVTHEILANMPQQDFIYDFTDISTYFLENAAQEFKAYPQLRYSLFNIDQEPGLQGYELGSYDLVIGANSLHDSSDVNFASRCLRALLKPDGAMLLVEGTTNSRYQLVSFGFLEDLTHYADERLETNLPMLAASSWQKVMQKAGFARNACFPSPGSALEAVNFHVMLGQNDGSDRALNTDSIQRGLSAKLATHMVPMHWHHLLDFPLTCSGKIDRECLASKIKSNMKVVQSTQQATVVLGSDSEITLAAAWSEILGTNVDAADANFFILGGDSLLMTRLGGLLKERHGVHLDLASLLKNPRLSDQARLFDSVLPTVADDVEESYETGVI